MQLIRGLHNLNQPLAGSVITLGNFDGVHLGHQQLLMQLKQKAKALNVPTVVISFEPQPKEFFAKRQTVPRMMRFSEKYLALQKLGIDYLCVLYFDEALSQLSAEDFVNKILSEKLGMRAIVVGYDFHFGAKRLGDFSLLKKMGAANGFEAIEFAPVSHANLAVSSTRLRRALSDGDMHLADQLLGRHYSLRGKVTYGHQRGRDLGFPTANINLHRELVPISGVFVVRVKLKAETFNGVANVGIRPTFNGQRVLLEVHLFDFDQTIYGCNLQVEFLHKLRDEVRFENFDELSAQIHKDAVDARKYFMAKVEP